MLRTLHNLPIERKLRTIITLTNGVILFLLCAVFLVTESIVELDVRDEEVRSIAEILAQNVAPTITFEDEDAAEETLGALSAKRDFLAAAVFINNDQLFASHISDQLGIDDSALTDFYKANFLDIASGCDNSAFSGTRHYLCHTIMLDKEVLGQLFILSDLSGLYADLYRMVGLTLAFFFIAFALAYVLARFVSRLIARPIQNLVDVADIVSRDKDYSLRAEKQGEDEIGRLTDGFNHMLLQVQLQDASLEAKVEERTLALEQTVAELELAKLAAEKANQAKSEFLSRMSHELRTPLNAILGFAQLMRDDEVYTLEPVQIEELNEILKAGRHLLELINEVLDLARIESGGMEFRLEPVNCHKTIEDCMALVAPMATERDICINFEPDSAQSAIVNADSVRLRQVIINLLSNAVKYNRDGGGVTITLYDRSEKHMRLEIRDTGAGLEAEQMDKLFVPFNRLGAETTGVDGTGIGLVICKHLVKAMKGKIGVESIPGQGSTFWIELPTSYESEVQESGKSEASVEIVAIDSVVDQKTVLYIEDNPANVRLVESLMKRRPHVTMLFAHTGKLGVEIAQSHQPDLILLDITLPDIDGYTVLQQLRSDSIVHTSPVIAVSANAMECDIEKGMSAGFIHYLTKPIDVRNFYAMVDQVLAADTKEPIG